MAEQKETKRKGWHRTKNLFFGESSMLATTILIAVIIVSFLAAYFGCDKIARDRGMNQFEDAANTVIDQINSKFERDGEVLESMAEILAESEAFADNTVNEDALLDSLRELKPLRQTMNLRILLPNDLIYLPDELTLPATAHFDFETERAHDKHISHRFESAREGYEGTQLIAHFVPIVKNGEKVALLYGVTVLSQLPSMLRTDNIYNSNASVMIFDVKNEGHATIMDTLNGTVTDPETGARRYDPSYRLQSFEDFGVRDTGGKSWGEVTEDIFSKKSGYTQVKSPTTGEWLCFYYAPARGVVADQWEICISVPASVAFGDVELIGIVFIIVGIVCLVAFLAYVVWMHHIAKKTVQKTVERAVLEEKLHKAEAAEHAKTIFLSNMSHDIRTPMNAILGFAALAETNLDNPERVQDYLKKILSSGNHLLSLINDILDMSRIESGKLNIEEKPCNISDIFRDMRNIIQTQMKSKQLNFYMDTLDIVDEDIFCDKLHINQVLLNLLSNAIKFTPVGGSVSLVIRQKTGAPTGYGAYEIRVKDTGIGMSEEFAARIFEPFERERTSTVSGIQGSGLGMAITKSIVDTMGGTIEVKTEKGKGSEFIINLQFRLQSERKFVEVIKELEGLRALVVDDDFDTCDSVSKMLGRIGMRPEWTLYGKEAVLRARQASETGDEFSVYIVDWVMPDLSGFEIVREIRRIAGDDVPIIVITAYDVSAIMEEAKDIGISAYCNKPIFLSELRDTLASAVESGNAAKDPSSAAIASEEDIEMFTGKRLLLVEDNELNREIAEEILRESGFDVEEAENGAIAVEKVSASAPGYYDLVLMDIQMPVMDGYEATMKIRALENKALASVPIVAMTANAFDDDRKKAADCGMNAHVAKPIDIKQLMKVLKEHLAGKE